MRSAIARSIAVLVGDLNTMVSVTMAAASNPASFLLGITPRSKNMLVMMVQVLPTGSFRT